ncbi:MAG: hypothetical protein R2773_07430 [Flavobacteriaceae bacterium]
MKHKKYRLHTAKINNHCPECFSKEGLEFTFSQTKTDHPLYTKANKEIEEVLFCYHCQHTIYPINWTEDIERVYEYHKKPVTPKNSGIKLSFFSLHAHRFRPPCFKRTPLLFCVWFFD